MKPEEEEFRVQGSEFRKEQSQAENPEGARTGDEAADDSADNPTLSNPEQRNDASGTAIASGGSAQVLPDSPSPSSRVATDKPRIEGPHSRSSNGDSVHTQPVANVLDRQLSAVQSDAPFCDVCGHITIRNGTCYKCLNCGNSMGCRFG